MVPPPPGLFSTMAVCLKTVLQPGRDFPRHHVVGAARRERHDDADGPGWENSARRPIETKATTMAHAASSLFMLPHSRRASGEQARDSMLSV